MVIYNMRLAGWLMQQGFVLHELKRNNDGSRKNVFIFKDSEEIRAKIEEFKLSKAAEK